MLMFCVCVCVVGVDWVNVNVAAAEMLFWHVFLHVLSLDCKMLVQLFGSQSCQRGFFQACVYLSALVFVFVGEAFVCARAFSLTAHVERNDGSCHSCSARE